MYTIRTYTHQYQVYELCEPATGSWFRIVPERGGIVTSFGTNGVERLYLDEATLLDPQANIRGGIPVLFPICGGMPNGRYDWNGVTYSIKSHGVARNEVWEVVATNKEGEASITVRLVANRTTLVAYPFEFELLFTYRLREGKLTIDQQYSNLSGDPMPMYAGFHPYFATSQKNVAIFTDAAAMYDCNDNLIKPVHARVDLTERAESVILLDMKKRDFAFLSGDHIKVHMKYGEDFRYLVGWTMKDRPFVCMEPWMAKPGEMARGEELVRVMAGQTYTTSLTIWCESVVESLNAEIRRLRGELRAQASKGMNSRLRDALYE